MTDTLSRLERAVARLEALYEVATERDTDFERRLRALERWRWLMAGGAAAVGTLVGMLLKGCA